MMVSATMLNRFTLTMLIGATELIKNPFFLKMILLGRYALLAVGLLLILAPIRFRLPKWLRIFTRICAVILTVTSFIGTALWFEIIPPQQITNLETLLEVSKEVPSIYRWNSSDV